MSKLLKFSECKVGMRVKAIDAYSGRLVKGETYVITIVDSTGIILVKPLMDLGPIGVQDLNNPPGCFPHRFTKGSHCYLANNGEEINV